MGLEDVSMFPSLLEEMLRRNWTVPEVEGLVGNNIIRVFTEVERVRLEPRLSHVYTSAQQCLLPLNSIPRGSVPRYKILQNIRIIECHGPVLQIGEVREFNQTIDTPFNYTLIPDTGCRGTPVN